VAPKKQGGKVKVAPLEKVASDLCLTIMFNDESGFVRTLKQNPHYVMTEVKSGETPLHIAVLRYFNNPFFLRYILTYPPSLVLDHLENDYGYPAFFLAASYLQD
jgi:hypothetical protein